MRFLPVTLMLPADPEVLEAMLEGLAGVNAVLIQRYGLPRLYETDVRYKREAPGREAWQNAVQTLELGLGDCEDLSAYRAAELRVFDGEPARPRVIKTGARRYHAIVERADGRIEDPSRALGMGGG